MREGKDWGLKASPRANEGAREKESEKKCVKRMRGGG